MALTTAVTPANCGHDGPQPAPGRRTRASPPAARGRCWGSRAPTAGSRGGIRMPMRSAAATAKLAASAARPQPGPARPTTMPPQGRPGDVGAVAPDAVDGDGLRPLISRDDGRQQPGRGRVVEAQAGAAQGGADQQFPDVRGPGQHDDRGRRLGRALQQVGGDHDLMTRQPVGDHAAEQEEHDHGQQPGGGHVADVGCRTRGWTGPRREWRPWRWAVPARETTSHDTSSWKLRLRSGPSARLIPSSPARPSRHPPASAWVGHSILLSGQLPGWRRPRRPRRPESRRRTLGAEPGRPTMRGDQAAGGRVLLDGRRADAGAPPGQYGHPRRRAVDADGARACCATWRRPASPPRRAWSARGSTRTAARR